MTYRPRQPESFPFSWALRTGLAAGFLAGELEVQSVKKKQRGNLNRRPTYRAFTETQGFFLCSDLIEKPIGASLSGSIFSSQCEEGIPFKSEADLFLY